MPMPVQIKKHCNKIKYKMKDDAIPYCSKTLAHGANKNSEWHEPEEGDKTKVHHGEGKAGNDHYEPFI